jgi:hypothetical protein
VNDLDAYTVSSDLSQVATNPVASGQIFAISRRILRYGGEYAVASFVQNNLLKQADTEDGLSWTVSDVDATNTNIFSSEITVVQSGLIVGGYDATDTDIDLYRRVGNDPFQPLRTVTAPSGTLIDAIFGGKRVEVIGAPDSDQNCVFYETISGPTTNVRLNCANGTTPDFDQVIDTDVAPTSLSPDKNIESHCLKFRATINCVYSHRSSDTVRITNVPATGGSTQTQVLGAVPSGSEIFSYGLASGATRGGAALHVTWPSDGTLQHAVVDPATLEFHFGTNNPDAKQGPVRTDADPLFGPNGISTFLQTLDAALFAPVEISVPALGGRQLGILAVLLGVFGATLLRRRRQRHIRSA